MSQGELIPLFVNRTSLKQGIVEIWPILVSLPPTFKLYQDAF